MRIKVCMLLIVQIIEYNIGHMVRTIYYLAMNLFYSIYIGSVVGTTAAGTTSNAGSWSYQLSSPASITFDPYGYLYVMDMGNSRVQKWWPGAAYGTTVVAASLNSAYGLQFDNSGNIVIADTYNHRIVTFGMLCRKYSNKVFIIPFFSNCSTFNYNDVTTTL